MARRQVVAFDARAGRGERRRELVGAGPGGDRVAPSGEDQHWRAGKVGPRRVGQRRHGAQQDRARERLRMQHENRRGDVRAVRVAQCERLGEAVGAPRLGDETAQLGRPAPHVVLVEQTLAEAAEEARHAVLEHVPPRRKQRRSRRDLAAERQEVGLVAARAMQKQNWRKARINAGLEAMDIGELGRHHGFGRNSIGRVWRTAGADCIRVESKALAHPPPLVGAGRGGGSRGGMNRVDS